MFKRILFLAVFLSLISSMFFTVNVQAKSNLSVEWGKPYGYCSEKEFIVFPVMSIHKQTIFTYLKVFYSDSFAVNQSNPLFGSIWQTITDWYGSLHIKVSSTILTYICIFLILGILLLVIRIVGIFGFKNWEARGNIGPLIIEEINDHPGFSLMLKKYLCNCGAKLSNPTNTSAPSSTPGFSSVKAALEATNESQGKILAAIFEICGFIVSSLGLKKNGYTITSTFPEDDDQGSVKSYIEIKYLFNNKLVMSNALEAVTYDELLKKISLLDILVHQSS